MLHLSIHLATPPSTYSKPETKSNSNSKYEKVENLLILLLTLQVVRGILISTSLNQNLKAFPVEDQRKMMNKSLKKRQKMRKEANEMTKMSKHTTRTLDYDD